MAIELHAPTGLRHLFYDTWRRLPARLQGLAIRAGAAKVTLGACAIIHDAQGRVLLAHHTYRRQPWGLPGGLIGQDEQPAAALARELREELGVTAHVGPLLHADTYVPGRHLTLYYQATLAGTPRVDGAEIDGYRYVAPEELPALFGTAQPRWLAYLSAASRAA